MRCLAPCQELVCSSLSWSAPSGRTSCSTKTSPCCWHFAILSLQARKGREGKERNLKHRYCRHAQRPLISSCSQYIVILLMETLTRLKFSLPGLLLRVALVLMLRCVVPFERVFMRYSLGSVCNAAARTIRLVRIGTGLGGTK